MPIHDFGLPKESKENLPKKENKMEENKVEDLPKRESKENKEDLPKRESNKVSHPLVCGSFNIEEEEL